jgi:hypothetical protein
MTEYPKSYMSDEEREELRQGGMSQNGIYLAESLEAGKAGDEEAAWAWLSFAELPAHTLLGLKNRRGAQFIRQMKLRTTKADAAYGPGWLDRA